MNKTTDNTYNPNRSDSGTSLPDDYTIPCPGQKTYTMPIILQEKQQNDHRYFVDSYYGDDNGGRPFTVYECVSIIVVDKYSFKTMKEAVTFIREKGGI